MAVKISIRLLIWYLACKDRKMAPTIREVLQREIAKRAAWILDDCHTFFRVRHDKLRSYRETDGISSRPIGGGNFLMLMGQVNVLGLLAKVHLHLVKPEEFATDGDVCSVKEAKREISEKLPHQKAVVRGDRTEWKPPRVGECNEEKAFRKLIVAMSGKVDLGLSSSEEAGQVWRQFRNQLTHMAWPEGSVAVYQL